VGSERYAVGARAHRRCHPLPAATADRLIAGLILLALFIPQHILLWPKFPVWYHLTFLLSLVPLTSAGGTMASRAPMRGAPTLEQATS